MDSETMRLIVEKLLLCTGFVFVAMVLLAAVYEVRYSLRRYQLRHKRAKRRHITVVIDGIDVGEGAISATIKSLERCRYPAYDAVIMCRRQKGAPRYSRARRYYPAAQMSVQRQISEAYQVSRGGEYVVIVPAGTEFHSGTLQAINREFHFAPHVQKLRLEAVDRRNATLLESWEYLSGTIRRLWNRALASVGLYRNRSWRFVALRREAVAHQNQLLATDILSSAVSSPAKHGFMLAGMMYVIICAYVIYDYFVYANKIQLLIALAFVAAISLIANLIDSWSNPGSRRLMLMYSPSAFFVIAITSTVSVAEKIKGLMRVKSAARQVQESGNTER